MKRLSAILALIVSLGACAPLGKPNTPSKPILTTGSLTVRVFDSKNEPIPGATVYAEGIFADALTDPFGRTFPFVSFPARFGLCAKKEFYLTRCEDTTINSAADLDQTLVLGGGAKPINGGERGPLYRDGLLIRRTDGTIFPWVGASDFSLFARYARGENILPILDQRITIGFNILRVFGMFDHIGIGGTQGSNLGEFSPANTPDYYVKLRAFADLLASKGIRFEFVYFADAEPRSDGSGGLMPDPNAKRNHIQQVYASLLGTWNVTHEMCNECFKNFNDPINYSIEAVLGLRAYGIEILDVGQETINHLDYIGLHDHERKPEWPRTARSIAEIRDGFSWDPQSPKIYQGSRTPVAGDEPMGFAEIFRDGARAVDVNDAAYYAGVAALMGAGSTFHSDDGVGSRLFGPKQLEAAKAWAFAARWVPPEAQTAPYQRGGSGGGVGIGDMPVEHHDLEENIQPGALRTYAKNALGFEWVVRIRPTGPTIPRRGCVIVEEPRLGFAKLKCAA